MLSTMLVAALSAVNVAWAAALPEADILSRETSESLEKRATTSILVCNDINLSNCVILEPVVQKCTQVPTAYNNTISSVLVGDNTTCLLFDKYNCVGSTADHSFITIGGSNRTQGQHEYKDLRQQNFNDVISSIFCVVSS